MYYINGSYFKKSGHKPIQRCCIFNLRSIIIVFKNVLAFFMTGNEPKSNRQQTSQQTNWHSNYKKKLFNFLFSWQISQKILDLPSWSFGKPTSRQDSFLFFFTWVSEWVKDLKDQEWHQGVGPWSTGRTGATTRTGRPSFNNITLGKVRFDFRIL